MPLVNGQKMACAPCIRGHRSTKCDHANERLMIPVRKPGRPLSTCPHPASRPCACGQVTAAIPKKQKCHCGSKNGAPTPVKSEGDDSTTEATPPSPSKPQTNSNRITKTSKRSAGRKQSVDVTGLSRMEPSQLNVMPSPFSSMTPTTTPPLNGNMPSIPDMPSYGAVGMAPPESPLGAMMFPMFPTQMQPMMISPPVMTGVPNGQHKPTSNGSMSEPSENQTQKPGSCCGGRAGTTTPPTTEPSGTSTPNDSSESKTGNCCSSGLDSPKAQPKTDGLPASGIPPPNGMMMAPFPAPMMMPNGMFNYYAQPTVFTYPPQYGSFMQPLQPEQWRQMMASMAFGQMAMAPYGMPTPVPYQAPAAPQSADGTSHQCSCGDGCQCIGCAAHPYNEATQNYVRSAWEMMQEGELHETRSHAQVNGNGSHEASPTTNGFPNGVSTNGSNGNHAHSRGNSVVVTTPVEMNKPPTAPQTPSDGTSGLGEELPANDFFFVSYPFGEGCAGDMASCPCGDDCQCLSCVIHNNPGRAD